MKEITMDTNQLQIVAGAISTFMFVSSSIPMVFKAYKTKDLSSYSLGNIALANFGNLIHWIYVSGLPLGPVWVLHGFNTIVTVLMFIWYWRFEVGCALSEVRVRCLTNMNECTGAR